MKPEVVKLEVVEDHIAVVSFANPPVNAHSQQLLDEVAWTFDTVSDRGDIREWQKSRRMATTGRTAAAPVRPTTASWNARNR